jgi:hypothetical protein
MSNEDEVVPSEHARAFFARVFAEEPAYRTLFRERNFDMAWRALDTLVADTRGINRRVVAELEEIGRHCREAEGEEAALLNGDYIDHGMRSIFVDAALSHAVVAGLASFMEGVLRSGFLSISGRALPNVLTPLRQNGNPRWRKSGASFWDPRVVVHASREGGGLVGGTLQLVRALEVEDLFPADFERLLGALFGFRHAAMHNGYEWPTEERLAFRQRSTEQGWPEDWFAWATDDEAPWVCSLSVAFTDRCLALARELLVGMGETDRRLRGLPTHFVIVHDGASRRLVPRVPAT